MFRNHAVARSTNTTYRNHWKQWCRFSKQMKWSPWLSPLRASSSRKLGYFAVYCWKFGSNRAHRGNTFSTIQLKLASIKWYHRRYLGVDLQTTPDLQLLMRGIKRASAPVLKKHPITPAFLRLLRRRINIQLPRQRLLWGSVLLGFFFLL